MLQILSRETEDPKKAAAAVKVVREGTMSIWHATETFAVSKTSIHKRLKGVIPMDSKVGPSTVLTQEDEAALVDSLLWAGRHQLALGRSEMVDAVRTLYLGDHPVPWRPEIGPGREVNLHLSGEFSEVTLLFQSAVLDSFSFGRGWNNFIPWL